MILKLLKKNVLFFLLLSLTFASDNTNRFKFINPTHSSLLDEKIALQRDRVETAQQNINASHNVHLPDSVFRSILVNEYKFTNLGSDSIVASEAAALHELWLSGSVTFEEWQKGHPNDEKPNDSTHTKPRIKDLTGIDAFKNIHTLIVEDHDITSLSLDSLYRLETLSIYRNKFATINLAPLVNLRRLNVVSNPFTGNLNFSALQKLEVLYVGAWPDGENTNITAVDVTAQTELKELYINALPNLTSLNLSANTKLYLAWIGRAGLTALDFSKNNELREVFLEANNLPASVLNSIPHPEVLHHLAFNHMPSTVGNVDLSKFPNLGGLELIGNQLTSIDLSPVRFLWYLNLDRNGFNSIDLTGFINLNTLKIRHNQLTSLNVEQMDNLEELKVDSNQLTELFLPFSHRLSRFSARWTKLKQLDVAKYKGLDWWTDATGNQHPGYLDISHNDSLKKVFVWKIPFTFEKGKLFHDDSVHFEFKGTEAEAKVYIEDDEFRRILIEEYGFTNLNSDSILEVEARQMQHLDLSPWRHHHTDGDNKEEDKSIIQQGKQAFAKSFQSNISSVQSAEGETEAKGSIVSLRGIAAFKNLHGLNIAENQIAKLDISQNTRLEWLNMNGNNIDCLSIATNTQLRGLSMMDNPIVHNVNVSHLTNLENFWIGTWNSSNPNTKITALDLTKNPHLKSLGVAGLKNLTALDIRENKMLHHLFVGHNGITSINLENQEQLRELGLSGDTLTVDLNQLKAPGFIEKLHLGHVSVGDTFDASKFERLRGLDMWNNKLKAIILDKNFGLEHLTIGGNELDSIRLGHLKELRFLNLSHNNLSHLDLGQLNRLCEAWLAGNKIERIRLPETSELHHLDLQGNGLHELDIAHLMGLDRFVDEGGIERGGLLNLRHNPNLQKVYVWQVPFYFERGQLEYDDGIEFILKDGGGGEPETVRIPDPSFFKVLIERYGFEDLGDQKIRVADARGMVRLNLDSANIQSLEGIGAFHNLEELSARVNRIGVVEFHGNPNLRVVNLRTNRLRNVSFAPNIHIQKLDLSNNILEHVDTKENHELRQLNLMQNNLKRVFLARNERLHKLNLGANPLDSIDLTRNISLDTLMMSKLDSMKTVMFPKTSSLVKIEMESNKAVDTLDISYHKTIKDINFLNSPSLKVVYTWLAPLPSGTVVKKDSQTVLVQKANPIRAEFTAKNRRGKSPLNVEFFDVSFSPDSLTAWSWDFDGDGNSDSNERHPFFTYNAPGEYNVSLTVTDSKGNTSTVTKEKFVHVFNLQYVFEPDQLIVGNLHRGEHKRVPFQIKNTGDGDIFFHDVHFPQMEHIKFDIHSEDAKEHDGVVVLKKDSTFDAVLEVFSDIDIKDPIQAEILFKSNIEDKFLRVQLNGSEPPKANDDELHVMAGHVVENVFQHALKNDTDPNGDPITVVYFDDPLFGDLKRRELSTPSPIPNMAYVAPAMAPRGGQDNFSYVIAEQFTTSGGTHGDPNQPPRFFGTDTAKVRIFIYDRPEFIKGVQQFYTLLQNSTANLELMRMAVGLVKDKNEVSVTAEVLSGNVTTADINPENHILPIHGAEGWTGEAKVKLSLMAPDPETEGAKREVDTIVLTFMVVPSDSKPGFVKGAQTHYTILEDTKLTLDLKHIAMGLQPGSDTYSIAATSSSTDITLGTITNTDFILTATPKADYTGEEKITLVMSHETTPFDTLMVTLTVVPVDEIPPAGKTSFHFSTEQSLARFVTVYSDFDEELFGNPVLTVTDGSTNNTLSVERFSTAGFTYKSDYEVKNNGNLVFGLYGKDLAGNDTTVQSTLNVQSTKAGVNHRAKIDDDVSISFNTPHAMYFYTQVKTEKQSDHLNSKNETMDIVSKRYKTTASTSFTKGISVEFKYTGSEDIDKVAVYRHNPSSNKWDYVRSERSTDGFKTNIKEDGEYALFFNENFVYIPETFAVHQNYPNPFNPVTTLRIDLPEAQKVQIHIFNVLGQKVRTLVHEHLPAGVQKFTWNSKNDVGHSVSSGIYFYRVITDNKFITKKMVLIK